MHELLLHATVPSSLQYHLLQVLAGVTAMQPQPLLEHHLVFKPLRPRPSTAETGPQASLAQHLSRDLFYLQLVGDLKSKGSGRKRDRTDGTTARGQEAETKNGAERMEGVRIKAEEGAEGGVRNTIAAARCDGGAQIDFSANPWAIEYRDLPDVQGRQPATARLMFSVPITEGNPLRFVQGIGYSYISSYLLRGHAFTHNSIRLQLTQTLPLSSNPGDKSPPPAPTNSSRLTPLDQSGAFLLVATVRVQDGRRPDIMQAGFAELIALKETLRGIVELEPVDRIALDTRSRET